MNLEVLDGGLSVNEVSVVLGIEDSLVDVLTRKGDDRIKAVPEADRQELCAITVWSADQVSTLVALRCFVPDDARAENVLGVGLSVLRGSPWSSSSPTANLHTSLARRIVVEDVKALFDCATETAQSEATSCLAAAALKLFFRVSSKIDSPISSTTCDASA